MSKAVNVGICSLITLIKVKDRLKDKGSPYYSKAVKWSHLWAVLSNWHLLKVCLISQQTILHIKP